MRLGIHAYAWCSQWSNETLHLADKVKALGLDFIEIPLMCLETLDAAATRARLEANALDVCTSTVLLEGTDITSDDASTRKRGVDYLKDCVKATHDLGAKNFSGVIYSQHVKAATKRPGPRPWLPDQHLRAVPPEIDAVPVPSGLTPISSVPLATVVPAVCVKSPTPR